MRDAEDVLGRNAIMNSIERRWAKADHEIFVAAVIVNPFYKSTVFCPLPFLNNAGIHNMMSRLWKRFYRTAPPPEFNSALKDFLRASGQFETLKLQCQTEENEANEKVSCFFTL